MATATTSTTYWQDIIEYLKTDSEVKAWLESDNEATDLEGPNADDVNSWTEFFTYRGFNVLRILKLLKNHYDAYTTSATTPDLTFSYNVMVNGSLVARVYTNKEKLHRDVQFLITLFALRGNNIEKITKKSHHELSDILEMLKEKLVLDFDVHASNESLDDKTITIPRLCACFPTITCNLYHAGVAKYLVSLEQMKLPLTVSKAVLTPYFAACIPSSFVDLTNNVHLLFFIPHIIVDNVIHKKDKRFTDLPDILAYYKAAYESPATPLKSREKYMIKITLASADGKSFNTTITTAVGTAEDIIRDLRPTDPNLGQVIGALRSLQ